jgi:NADH-quinone oxidoreductase subunit E
MNLKKIDKIIKKYEGQDSWLVMILQDMQDEFNYLPEEALKYVAKKLDIPLSRVFSVATFYSSLSLTERGKHVVKVCDGTACHLRGSVNVCEEIKRNLDIEDGQTTEDKKFSLEVVACLGACALAPVMAVGSQYHGEMTVDKIKNTLESYK